MVNWNALDSAVPAGAAVSADAAGNAGREGSERQGRE
jgi:hypothetical protein